MSSEIAEPSSPAPRVRLDKPLAFAFAAYFAWGLVPIFWRSLGAVPAIEILAHRVAWSLLFIAIIVTLTRQWPRVGEAIRDRPTMLALSCSTCLIAVNWGLFIWAVQNGRILQTSIGYYMNPLVNVLLGVAILGERLRRAQTIAVLLALIGVASFALALHVLPWISLTLAITFGLYGLVRKRAPVDPIVGLLLETAIVAPLAIGFLILRGRSGLGALGHADARTTLLLIATGPVTALPLLWFAAAARGLTLTTLGFVQYLTPTLTLIVAVTLYGEHLTRAHFVTFACIWAALAIYTADSVFLRASTRSRAATRA